MTRDDPAADVSAPTLPRDTVEFAAGLLLGVAAGVGLGLALRDEGLRRSLTSNCGPERTSNRVRRMARRLGLV